MRMELTTPDAALEEKSDDGVLDAGGARDDIVGGAGSLKAGAWRCACACGSTCVAGRMGDTSGR